MRWISWVKRIVTENRRLANDPNTLHLPALPIALILFTLGAWALLNASRHGAEYAAEKMGSAEIIASYERACSEASALVEKKKSEGAPGYEIRYAERRLEATNRELRRVKADEKILMDVSQKDHGYGATPLSVKIAVGALDKIAGMLDGKESAQSQLLRAKITDLDQKLKATTGQPLPLSGDDLDFFMAATELNHITNILRSQGYDENDPAFINVLERYRNDFYLQSGERPLPQTIRQWVDILIAVKYGEDEETVVAVGKVTPIFPCPEDTFEKNTLTLQFPRNGGDVTGKAEVIERCRWHQECQPARIAFTITYTGTYSLEWRTMAGEMTIQAQGVLYEYDPETEDCSSKPVNLTKTASWSATVEGETVKGIHTVDSEDTDTFELKVQAQ